jgi:hypothetical protein
MLNRPKLLSAINQKVDLLFPDYRHEYDIARHVWQQICADSLFAHKVAAVSAPWPVPTWNGQLDAVYTVEPLSAGYQAISVDGSQIYPDRHQYSSCFLVNIGSVAIDYGNGQRSTVSFDSEPFVFSMKEYQQQGELSRDFINAQRQYLEMLGGLKQAAASQESQDPTVLFFDGSLIFWHLESKSHDLLAEFLPRYLGVLSELYDKKIVTVGYISMPRSRELVNLIRLQLCEFTLTNQEPWVLVDGVVDSAIVGFYVELHHRTTVFKNNAQISASYPDSVAPYFFYLNVGDEIARVEIAAWIAQDKALTDLVASIVLDQALKGRGYPVVLAEAHEQAVVKGPDRQFFYHVLDKVGIDQKRTSAHSIKSMRKRSMGV